MKRAGWRVRAALLIGALAGTLMSTAAVGAVLATPAHAAGCTKQAPGAYPNNPGYAGAENGVKGQTWDSEAWYLYGCMPQGVPLASDTEGASGMSVDALWNAAPPLRTRGRPDVIVAYMEGGINWRIPQSCALRTQSHLNRNELPYPEDAQGRTPLDINPNATDPYLLYPGKFDVDQYLNDPRVRQALVGVPKSPAGGPFLHHVCSTIMQNPYGGGATTTPVGNDITPEDLIVAFGHCQISAGKIVGAFPCDPTKHFDNDSNGYPNDISGWNFNRDNNDPQTEQSIYAHFTDESSQLAAQADNGFGTPGMCPDCSYLPVKMGDEAIDRPDRVAEAIVFAVDSGAKVIDTTDASLGFTPEVAAAVDYAYHKGVVIAWASNDFESADHTEGMLLPHVWPGNSIVGDHSTRVGATCNVPPTSSTDAYCAFVRTNATYRSRSSLTSYGPHALFSVPNNDGSTSTGIPTQAGVAALVASAGLDAVDAHAITAALNADEIKQVVRMTASPISNPGCPPAEACFTGAPGSFNRMYGYGRPNVYRAAQAVFANRIPPTVDIRTPGWYQDVDPFAQPSLHVGVDVAALRARSYSWQMQVATGPDPSDSDFKTFATGTGAGAQTVGGNLDLAQLRAYASAPFAVDEAGRTSIEAYDVTIRVQVTDDRGLMGEDRRAFHARHDTTMHPGFPIHIGMSGDASPTMADIEGRGRLDTIIPTSDGQVHAFRPDGTEAPGFPVRTGPAPGMDPSYDSNYLRAPTWRDNVVPRPRDGIFSAVAVGDLRHDGALEIVTGTVSGYTYAWDGAGRLLPGFPVLDGTPANFHTSVPPPDTPYAFSPENVAGTSPVLADLTGDRHLDIIQAAGDNHVYAWHVDAHGMSAVPGWPVCTIFDPQPGPGQPCVEQNPPAGTIHTHDGKIVPTPAIADVEGNGASDLIVGLEDTTFPDQSPVSQGPVTAYIEAFYPQGTKRSTTGQIQGWPVSIPGLLQGYGTAQDFVTQGTESPAVYDTPNGPQIVVNANLFLPVRVDARTRTVSSAFAGASIPPSAGSTTTPNSALVQFTTSASVGHVLPGAASPQVFQGGSAGVDVALGITQTPGLGTRVDNGIAAWDPTTGLTLQQFDTYVQGLSFFTAPAIADVTGDGTPDVLQDGDSAAVTGLDGTSGRAATGWPKWTGGFSLFTPAVGDLTGSGHVSVAATTREGYLYMWDTPGLTAANHEAWHWHQNDRNTGHYGTDTRPPAAVRDLSVNCSAGGDTLRFTAPGDDWNAGTAASYQVFRSGQPITQDTLASATPVAVSQSPRPAGTRETLHVADVSGQCDYAVRAVDAAGNIGPVRVSLPAAGRSGSGHVEATATTTTAGSLAAGSPSFTLAGLAFAAGSVRSRRRRRTAAR